LPETVALTLVFHFLLPENAIACGSNGIVLFNPCLF